MRALIFAALLVPAVAHADTDTTYHVDAGVELEGGNVASAAFRSHALVGNSFGSGHVRPQLAAGATFGVGSLYVDDPRAVDTAVGVNFWNVGPELQAGLQFYDGSEATVRVFASVAYLRVGLDSRLMLDPLPGVGGDHGQRASLGLNWARAEAKGASENHCTKKDCDLGFLMLFAPQQAELTVEGDAGSTRYGVALTWGS